MYMPGRLRTASRPRSTVIRLESETVLWTPCSASWLDSVIRLGTPTATGEPAPRHISYGCFNCSNFRAEPPSGRSSDGISGRIHPTLFHVEHDVFVRSEEHTSELQSLMRISYAVFCLKKKIKISTQDIHINMH